MDHLSGQIKIFHQPRFPWNQGFPQPNHHLGAQNSCEAAIIWPDLWSILSYFSGFTSPTKSQKPMDSHFHSCVISGEPPGLRGKDRHLKGRLRRGFQQSTLDSASQCLRISNFWPPKKTLPNHKLRKDTVDDSEIPNNHLGCKIPCTKHYETW